MTNNVVNELRTLADTARETNFLEYVCTLLRFEGIAGKDNFLTLIELLEEVATEEASVKE